MLSSTRRHVLREDTYVPHVGGRFVHHSRLRPRQPGNRHVRPDMPLTDADKPVRTKPTYDSLRNQVLGYET